MPISTKGKISAKWTRHTLLSTNPMPQESLWKANTFCHCATIKKVYLDPYPEKWDIFSCLNTYTCLAHCTYNHTQLYHTAMSDFILYREYSSVCRGFFIVLHNHSLKDMFVYIETPTVDRSHVFSTARGVSISMLISTQSGF